MRINRSKRETQILISSLHKTFDKLEKNTYNPSLQALISKAQDRIVLKIDLGHISG